MEFGILGSLEARTDGGPVTLGGPRQRALLALLLLNANELLTRDRLIEELWDGRPPQTAAKVLQNGVASLRKTLAPERIATHGSGYAFKLEPDELDATRFERLVDESRRALAAGDAEAAVATLRRGEALWRGAALADFAYDSFARAHSFRLDELRVAAIEDRIDAELALGEHASVVPELQQLVMAHPLRERLRGQLMLALYRSGRQVEGLEVYRAGRRALVEELGMEPGPALQQLERQMLVQDAELEVERPTRAPAPAHSKREPAIPVRTRLTALVVSIRVAPPVDGELLARVLGRAAETVARVLERHEAVVEQLTADQILGVFGLPELHEDDALRAARAALELREALAGQADDGPLRLEAAFGIDTAELLLDDPERRPSLAAGQAVGAARSLAEAAPAGEIVAGAAASALLRGAATLQQIEGERSRVVEVRAEAIAIPRRLDAPLVGRSAELGTVERAYQQAAGERRCQLFTLLGGAGLGKTRLARELRGRVEPEALVLLGGCPPYGDAKTFLPLAEIVRQAVGSESRTALLARLAGVPDAPLIAERVAAAVGWSDAPVPGPETFWAVRRLLEALAAERPLVVVFDDLHWAEPMLLDLIEHVAELALGSPLLLLCLARPELLEEAPRWGGGKPNAATLSLQPLSDDESARLIESLLGRAALAPEARAAITRGGGGNPLFIEQILSTLIDEGALRRERGRWIATADMSERPMPATLQALLAARLGRLGPAELRAAQAAAVAGAEFTRESAADLTGQEPAAVEPALEALVRKDLIRPAPPVVPGEVGYRFRHVLIRDAAYDSLPKVSRAELHARFGQRLEAQGEQAHDHNGLVGHHLAAAHGYRIELGQTGADTDDLAARASVHLAAAGRAAADREDARAAVQLLRRAIDLRPDDPASAALLPMLSDVLNVTGRFDESAEVIDRAIAAAMSTQDEALEWDARVAGLRLRIYSETPPTPQEIRDEAAPAIAALERLGDDRGLGRVWATAAQAPWWEGRAAEAADWARRSIAYSTSAGDRLTAGRSTRTFLGTILFGPTPVDEGIAACQAILTESGDAPLTAAAAMRAQAGLQAMAGNFAVANELVARDRALVADLGARLLTFNVAQVAVLVALLAGDATAAIEEARAAIDAAESLGILSVQAEFGAVLAQALALAGRFDEALVSAERAERVAEDEGDAVDRLRWRTAKAPLLARRGDHAEAEHLAREAVAAAAATDFLWLHGDALVAWADTLEAAGRHAESASARDEALALYARKGNVAAIERARHGR